MQKLPLTVPVALLGAANLLRTRGWIAGQMTASDGRMCMIGALQRFVAESGLTDPVVIDNLVTDATDEVKRTIWALPSGANRPHPTAWNDRHCKSAEDAITVLELAARQGRL